MIRIYLKKNIIVKKKNEKVKMNGIRHAKVNGRAIVLCKEKQKIKLNLLPMNF